MSRLTFDWSDRIDDDGDPAALDREFVVGDTLGEGGMGIVHLAEQRSLGRTVAIKRPRPGVPPSSWARLRREARVTGWLQHPGIVPIYALGVGVDGEPLVVMKRIEGVRWTELIERPADHAALLGDDPLQAHVDVLIDVCRALEYAHARGVLHLDLKPDNVMVGAFGEVYLLDWGLAVAVAPEVPAPPAAEVTSALGTPGYAAPEQARGDGAALSTRTDVFLVGATLHHVLTGAPRYRGDTTDTVLAAARECAPVAYASHVDPELARIAAETMSADPALRPEGVAAVRERLHHVRRHRMGQRLVDAASEALRAFLRQSSTRDPLALAHLASEARFGFRQALELAPDLDAARDGLRELARVRLERALDAEDPDAARQALLDLDDPEATARVDALERRRDRDRSELRAHRDDRDTARAAGPRAAAMFAAALVAASPSIGVEWGIATGRLPGGYWPAWIAVVVVNLLWLASLAWHARRPDLANAVTRNLAHLSGLSAVQVTAWFALAEWLDVPVRIGVGFAFLWGAALMSGVASYFDRRFGLPVVVYGLGSLVVLASPWTWVASGLAGGVGYAAIGWIAWVQAREADAPGSR